MNSITCENCESNFFFSGDVDDYLDGPNYIICPKCQEKINVDFDYTL